jgi:formylglycine-generating enzyme required for sulfatase activity
MVPLAFIAAVLALGCSSPSKDTPAPGSGTVTTPVPPAKLPPPPPIVKGGAGDCKTEYAPEPTRDPNPMCKVGGGTVTIGRMVAKVSPFLIDQLEVTNAQVAHYLNATKGDGCEKERECFLIGDGSPGSIRNRELIARAVGGGYSAVPGREQLPAEGVSKKGAELYCAWAGKVLPTDAMWVVAAAVDAGGKQTKFPWGDTNDCSRAKCLKPTSDNRPPDSEPLMVGTYDGTQGHGDGRSPWGALDMAGNVAEIVADCEYPLVPCKDAPCVDPPPHVAARCLYMAHGGSVQRPEDMAAMYGGRTSSNGFRCALR